MSDEPVDAVDPVDPVDPRALSGKKRYLLIAAGALVFLLILSGIVLAISSNMSRIEITASYDADSVPDYDIIKTQAHGSEKTFWIRAQEGSSPDDVMIIANHTLRKEKKSLSRIRFFFFVELDPETKAFKEPITDNIDYSLAWDPEDGVKLYFDRSVAGSGDSSRPPSALPFLRGFAPRTR